MKRYRRLRTTKTLRNLVRETTLSADDFIQPFFVVEGTQKKESIASMPGIFRYSPDILIGAVEEYVKAGGEACLLFGIPEKKDAAASQAYALKGVVPTAIQRIKKEFPDFLVATDVCLCAYMDHGHCGVMHNQTVDNDKTLPLLAKMALTHAEAGCDIVAPSDMMDFRVQRIREELDKHGFLNVVLMSYAVKYASAYYGPFREAADSAPQFGDRRTYQMDYANSREAVKEALQDIEEGADIVMVKPALAYLDIIASLRQKVNVPVAAYSVSGEYSMIKAAAEKNWVNESDIVLESLTAMKRAGADIIITYHAQEALKWLG
ncbi:MAG: delta-aminolevulinic acid dehydratase [Omnitrophica WOR_2 bacterium RIFCSPHIGHO2_02_FULL_50_17]|nr:MAG: delta-aminolevulinic acid dehydratase [Omnitrophica WOR_2 bacterium RIFCSPHIGHO2_02_FULL_50_17]